MDSSQERQLNQAAFRQLRNLILQNYPSGRFVAISAGEIVADAASFEELHSVLHHMGQHAADALVVQADVEYPETAILFAHPTSDPTAP